MTQPTISVRQHWLSLLRMSWIVLLLLTIFSVWVAKNPKIIVHFLHLTRHSPAYMPVAFYYNHWGWFTFGLLLLTAGIFFNIWSWWVISLYEIDNYALHYKVWPLSDNQIPLASIQDVQITRPLLGLIFNFGTLVLDSGRAVEHLQFVPEVDVFANAMRPYWYHKQEEQEKNDARGQ